MSSSEPVVPGATPDDDAAREEAVRVAREEMRRRWGGGTESDREAGSSRPSPAERVWSAWLQSFSWEVRHAVAVRLHAAAPGPDLLEQLHGLEVADLDEAALFEALAAWQRLASHATAGGAAVLAELNRRRRGVSDAFLADEVAATLSITTRAAEARLGLAAGMDRVPAIADALSRGEIDERRASVLTDELAHVDDDAANRIAADVLPRAATCTAPQLRQRLRRLELLRDPDGAAKRHQRACEQRRVELIPAPDAMAWLTAYLPADEARAVHDTLTALADAAVAAGGPQGEGSGADERRGGHAPKDERTLDQRRADVLVDLTTRWLDAGIHPDGTPLPTKQGRRPHLAITASAAMLAGLTDEPAELHGYGPIPPDMARRIAARSTWEPLLVDAQTGEPLARSTRRYAPTQPQRDLVVLRDRTCTFVGCRMPAVRCDIDHIAPYVEGADETTQPQTRVDNLQALCRHHHRLKTHGGWVPTRMSDGTTTWTAPSGQAFRRPPEHEPPVAPPPPAEPTCGAGQPPRRPRPIKEPPKAVGPPPF